MKDQHKAEEQQIDELTLLRRRIAELEALEAEHKRVEDALRESEERFHKIFDHSNDAIFIVDPTRDEILDVNPSSPLKNYLSTHINGKDAWSAGQINQGKEIEQETLIRG